MERAELIAVGSEWTERTAALLQEMLPLMGPAFGGSKWAPDEAETIAWLATAAARSSQTVLYLCRIGQLWDAEMILRSVFEGTVKFVYLLERTDSFAARYREFAHEQFEVALLKDHNRAKEFLEVVPDRDAEAWRAIRDRMLSDRERDEFVMRYDRKRRRDLDQRWGFTGLLTTFAKGPDPALKALAALAWGYSMMSHLQHADYVGISLPFDRHARPEEERDAMHLAHLARLLGDTATALFARLIVAYRFAGLDTGPVKSVAKKMDELHASFGGAYERWADLQYGPPK